MEEIEKKIYNWYVNNADILELKKKTNWFEIKINSIHKDKSIQIFNLEKSMEKYFNINCGRNNSIYGSIFFNEKTWEKIIEKIETFIENKKCN